jgi:hypothetical protein
MIRVAPKRGTSLIGKVGALHELGATKTALDQLYGILTILDQKATGLLTVNAFLIAVLTAFLAGLDQINKATGLQVPAEVLKWQMAALGVSAFLCLLVIRINWAFMRYVPKSPTTASQFDDEFRRIANVLYDRTRCYWFAWLFALAGFLLTLAWWRWLYVVLAAAVIIAWTAIRELTDRAEGRGVR